MQGDVKGEVALLVEVRLLGEEGAAVAALEREGAIIPDAELMAAESVEGPGDRDAAADQAADHEGQDQRRHRDHRRPAGIAPGGAAHRRPDASGER